MAIQGNGREGFRRTPAFRPALEERGRRRPIATTTQLTVLFPRNSLNAAALPFGKVAKSQSRPLQRLRARTMVRALSAGSSGLRRIGA